MKIALICTEKLPVPPVAGGAVQLYISEILPYISKEHDITVFSLSHPSLPMEETVDGVKFIRVNAKIPAGYYKKIKELLENLDFDLVHVFNRPRWVPFLSENLPKTGFSLSLHNEMFHPDKISEFKAKQCIKRVEFINTVSKFIADGVKKLYPESADKLNVVYSGVNVEKYSPNWSSTGMANKLILKKQYNLLDKKVILHVTRLSPKKGTHIVISAMKKVLKTYPDTALVVVGSKWYGKNEEDEYGIYCRNLCNDISDNVVFTGFIPPSEMPQYYNLGDIFVCASQWEEPLARVHYEAMAAGLPIITTDRGGNGEIFEEEVNGLLIKDYNNPNSFSHYINYLLSRPNVAEELGLNARKTALEKYTWQRVAEEVFAPIKNTDPDTFPNRGEITALALEAENRNEPSANNGFFPSNF
ncbi:glycosyltransferase family 4 protein [Acetivibrio saccincola]|jgi:spore coat protein SA|uniref:Spore coat protein SA n=1 Tax=Acetivibrio saccincola TaxID=1677857 RepID=A0A2K9E7B1_9FIRM|nr:glycosyltransferase family 4 protein [Acetivibrio saccincola]AUG57406.1 Spore coat protein SA [Acetivibrio saccincola]NLW26556.1 glycosyltransferase family 4 protein [Acetivibrio saccincola]HOA96193.1 glycosyltransferase family 4 protein [Acetivibrio saccincola]HQD29612.1 glycosyltransferase family 4 protein [Acetivibrio saccincola]